MRRAEAAELDRKRPLVWPPRRRENERRAKERLRLALEALTTGRYEKTGSGFYQVRHRALSVAQRAERWKANRAKRARPSIFRGGYWSDLSEEEEEEVVEDVEARPKKEMPCAKCGQRVVCVCESERYRVRKELRRKKLGPTRQKAAFARKHPTPADVDALVDLQQAEIARLAREEEQRRAYEEKFGTKK